MAETIKQILEQDVDGSIKITMISCHWATVSLSSLEEFTSIVRLAVQWIESKDTPAVGWYLLRCTERIQQNHMDTIVPSGLLDGILIFSESLKNQQEVAPLIAWFLKYKSVADAVAIKDKVLHFFCNMKPSVENLVSMIQLYTTNYQCLPHSIQESDEMLQHFVKHLSFLPMPSDSKGISTFGKDICYIEDFLREYLLEEGSMDLMFTCLKTVYGIISDSRRKRISPALASVLQMIDPGVILIVVEQIFHQNPKDESLVTSICTLCNWLVLWPRASHISQWIIGSLTWTLQESKYCVLYEACQATIIKLFDGLKLPAMRAGIEPVFYYMLWNTNATSDIFHRIVPRVPAVMKMLKIESTESSLLCLQNLLDNVFALMAIFPGFPSSYDHLWLARLTFCEGLSLHPKDENSLMLPIFLTTMPSDTVLPIIRSPRTPMIGLANNNNICYLNSLLQALFMTERFFKRTMMMDDGSSLLSLAKFQLMFAALKYSNKRYVSSTFMSPIYDPRNEMFGLQQDSSEIFLSILNKLHDEHVAHVEKGARLETMSLEQAAENSRAMPSATIIEPVPAILPANVEKGAQLEEAMDFVEQAAENSQAVPNSTNVKPMPAILLANVEKGAQLEEAMDFVEQAAENSQAMASSTNVEPMPSSLPAVVPLSSEELDIPAASVTEEKAVEEKSGTSSEMIIGDGDTKINETAHSLKPDSGTVLKSISEEVFGGMFNITYRCLNCKSDSQIADPFREMLLSFPPENDEDKVIQLQDLLDLHFMPEELQGENSYQCSSCRGLKPGRRVVTVTEAPVNLVITLKMFGYDDASKKRVKLHHKVSISEQIELPVASQGNETVNYVLYAVVVHSGPTVDSGHYFAYARDEKNTWYSFNDTHVRPSSFKELCTPPKSDTPYLLFFSKVGEPLRNTSEEFLSGEIKSKLLSLLVTQDDVIDERDRTKKHKESTRKRKRPDKRDDNEPPSSCGGGGGGIVTSTNFVF